MYFLLISFIVLLLAIIAFLLYKTTMVRHFKAQLLRHEDYGDKDSWVLGHARRWRTEGHKIAKEKAGAFVIFLAKHWMKLVHKVNGYIRRKYPELSYLIGDKQHIKTTSEVNASPYLDSIRKHREEQGNDKIEDRMEM